MACQHCRWCRSKTHGVNAATSFSPYHLVKSPTVIKIPKSGSSKGVWGFVVAAFRFWVLELHQCRFMMNSNSITHSQYPVLQNSLWCPWWLFQLLWSQSLKICTMHLRCSRYVQIIKYPTSCIPHAPKAKCRRNDFSRVAAAQNMFRA